MLRELRIENLLLIERVEMEFGKGLTVLTGETGAGKTVLAHSLDLLTGGKARKGIVRPGAEEAWVEGVFDLPGEWAGDPALSMILERLPAGAEELVLGRRVSAGGRTSAFINGRTASAPDLALVTERLVAFFGQHEHRKLTIASAQLGILDAEGGSDLAGILGDYREAWARYRRAVGEMERFESSGGGRDPELLRHELEEIDSARLDPGERESLEEELGRLKHADGLRQAAAGAGLALKGDGVSDGSSQAIAASTRELADLRGVDPELDRLVDRLEAVALEVDDLGSELMSYVEGLQLEPARLAAVEERLDLISLLELKYGGSTEAVLEYAERCRSELRDLEEGEGRREALKAELEESRAALDRAAKKLREAREAAAGSLSRRVTEELEELAMEGATLEVELVEESEPGPSGTERAEFVLSPNRGIEARPLREAASGGELSRVMLALVGSRGSQALPTLVFDEIDAGIGGGTASVVGEKLRNAAEGRQVIAITHLPQVASRADAHFSITKQADSDPAMATVACLEGDAVVAEITRMMGADAGDEAAARHARELVASVRSD